MTFPLTSAFFKKSGGGTPVIPLTATGVTVNALKYFEDVGFDLSGSGDYTFLAYFNMPNPFSLSDELVIFYQNSTFANGANRLSVTNRDIEVGGSTFATDSNTTDSTPSGVIIRKSAGTTDVLYLKAGVRYDYTSLSISDVSAPIQKSIGNPTITGITQTNVECEIIAVQQVNTALSLVDCQNILDTYGTIPSPDISILPYLETTGSSDNGEYPALMTGNTAPSGFVISASFESEPPFRAFDANYLVRTIIRNAAGTGSAGAWLKVDLGSGNAQAVDRYDFRSWPNQGLNSFTVSGSNDDISYTDLITDNGVNNTNIIQSFTWTNSTPYRYWRITCNSGFSTTQWTHYESSLYDRSKEWTTGGGFAKQLSCVFPS